MKRFDWIVGGLLGLFLTASPLVPNAAAQDDGYITPSKAREMRAKAVQERKAAEKRLAEKRAAQEAEQRKAEQDYQDKMTDWYNRRDMKVTIEEMEQNLDEIDGSTSSKRAPRVVLTAKGCAGLATTPM